MTSATPTVRQRWFAATYDLMAKLDEKRTRRLRQLIAGGAAGRVLELGCGTGLNLNYYDWSRVDSLDATEPDVHMLRRARAKASSLPAAVGSRVRLHEASAEVLPFADSAFDCLVVTLVLCTVADPDRALAEAWRLLRPGGQLRLLEHVKAGGLTGRLQRVVQPVYGWMAASCQLGRDTEAMVRAAGFELEVTERTSFGPLWPVFAGVATKPA